MSQNSQSSQHYLLTGLLIILSVLIGVFLVRDRRAKVEFAEQFQQLAKLDAEKKEKLKIERDRFDKLTAQRKKEMRSLRQRLEKAKDGQQLQAIMQRYSRWLAHLPSGQRADLLSLPWQDRIAAIERVVQDQQIQRFEDLLRVRLERLDLATISAWLEDFVAEHDDWVQKNEQTVLKAMSGDQQRRLERVSKSYRHRYMLKCVFLRQEFDAPPEIPLPGPKEIDKLVAQLSKKARDLLASVKDDQQKTMLIKSWSLAALWSRSRKLPDVDPQELERFYCQDLSQRDREYLERLPAERMQQRLLLHYHQYKRNNGKSGLRPPRARSSSRPQ